MTKMRRISPFEMEDNREKRHGEVTDWNILLTAEKCWSVMEEKKFIHRICETRKFVKYLRRENIQTSDTRQTRGRMDRLRSAKTKGNWMWGDAKSIRWSWNVSAREVVCGEDQYCRHGGVNQREFNDAEIRICDMMISVLGWITERWHRRKSLAHEKKSSDKVHGRTFSITIDYVYMSIL